MAITKTKATFPIKPRIPDKQVLSWTMYDWANSAFATTVMAAPLRGAMADRAGARKRSAYTSA